MSEPSTSSRPMGDRERMRRDRRARAIWWTVIAIVLTIVIVVSKPLYHFLKAKRAEQFAASADALMQAGKWNEAAKQYHAALQLDPLGYHGLDGAARLAAKADRPEAIDLWEQVVKLPQCTVQDRQEYAATLIEADHLSAAEKIIDPLLKNNPDTKTLEIAAHYSQKIGDNAKAAEFARVAVNRAPQDDAARFQLADILAQSARATEHAEARKLLWEIADRNGLYRKSAIEALARAPNLSPDEQGKIRKALDQLTPKTLTDDLLSADLQIQMQPDAASSVYDDETDRWHSGDASQLVELARWLNSHQQAERVLAMLPIERVLENNVLLLTRLDAMASLQRWTDIDETLTRPDLTLDPSVIESFRARAAQERGAVLDAEVHWNHAISLAGNNPAKLRFVATFAEESQANPSALKAYEQLARFPREARVAYDGAERVSRRTGDAAIQRAAAEKIATAAPEDPNAADQLAYLNLLLNNDVDANFAVARSLTEKYPNRLSYRIAAALGYLRKHDAGSALAEFNAPAPIDWNQAEPAWRAVYAASLLANDRRDEAQQIIATIPLDKLNAAERELIEAK